LTEPNVLGTAAVRMLKVVDFPAPFGPRRPKVYPFSMIKELSLTATKPFGYFLYKSFTNIGLTYATYLILAFSLRRSADLLKFI
jgi:hypothetical protein